jgi:cyclophilin family peptidyl-prolyl cis-trans isomerase
MKTASKLIIVFMCVAAGMQIGCSPKNRVSKQTSTTNTKVENKEQKVQISTDHGKIVLKLYNETPQHRDNFIKLVNDTFYHNLLFHRVIRNFMIQGGDPQSKTAGPGQQLGAGDIGYTVPAEFNPKLIHKKGALAAARQGDMVNPQKRSSGCQFYIVQGQVLDSARVQMIGMQNGITYTPEQIAAYTTIGGTPFLDMNYTVFGEVISGMEVIDAIAAVQTMPGDRPINDVKFTITLINE